VSSVTMVSERAASADARPPAVGSAAIFKRGLALMRNIRRGSTGLCRQFRIGWYSLGHGAGTRKQSDTLIASFLPPCRLANKIGAPR
jgi:hypothetical protein